jgi:tryptophanyl-tRNA synthetase
MRYGDVTKALADRVRAYFAPMRAKRVELAQRPDDIEDILREGARRARELATPTWQAARHAAGLGR